MLVCNLIGYPIHMHIHDICDYTNTYVYQYSMQIKKLKWSLHSSLSFCGGHKTACGNKYLRQTKLYAMQVCPVR